MIPERASRVLNYIVKRYIADAKPVPSQEVARFANLGVSPATIRNDMAYLEREGFLLRPHVSSGGIPSDKAYRHYVETLNTTDIPSEERRLIAHTFHQVEREVEAWVSLSATMLARITHNVAVVSMPKSADCRLKHFELIAIYGPRALAVAVLEGARVKQQIINFSEDMTQDALAVISARLNNEFDGMITSEIEACQLELSPLEQQARDILLELMKSEDSQEYEEPYLEGWHFILNQPEFTESAHMSRLVELVEQRGLLKVIMPARLGYHGVHVIIGKENKNEAIQNCSVVITRYGLPDTASGTIAVVGPTRMPYNVTIPTVYYLSTILGQLIAGLYGREYRANMETA